jgi:hypothetical protein
VEETEDIKILVNQLQIIVEVHLSNQIQILWLEAPKKSSLSIKKKEKYKIKKSRSACNMYIIRKVTIGR